MADVTSLVTGLLTNSSVGKAIADLETTVKAVFVSNNVPAQPKKVQIPDRVITMEEVSWHDEPSDCWIIIFDKVYDITKFLDEHPGGSEILLEFAGHEATYAFRSSEHSPEAISLLNKYLIGELPMHERIFRKPGGITPRDMPE